jgi:glycosyltransferase involved in cell wall biosynthesis
MKIFFINTTRVWGGGEKWHFETACAMQRRGHQVAMLLRPNSELYKKSAVAGLPVIPTQVSNTSFLNPFRIFSIARLLKREKPDVLILNYSADIKTVGLASKLAAVRHVVYRRGSAIPIRNTFFNRFLYGKIITRMLTNSEETKRSVLQNNKNLFPEDKISVIYNGIDLQQFDNLPETGLPGKKVNDIVIGSAGRLVEIKGQRHLIEMAVLLKKKDLNFKIRIAGDGPLMEQLKHAAAENQVDEQVEFLGFVDNMKTFMRNIDIFVFPSHSEGFGYVLVEAMACSKPVLAFNTGSFPETVADGQNGFLIKPFDVEDLSEKVVQFITHPDLREAFGKNGRKRAEKKFNLVTIQDQIEHFLTTL